MYICIDWRIDCLNYGNLRGHGILSPPQIWDETFTEWDFLGASGDDWIVRWVWAQNAVPALGVQQVVVLLSHASTSGAGTNRQTQFSSVGGGTYYQLKGRCKWPCGLPEYLTSSRAGSPLGVQSISLGSRTWSRIFLPTDCFHCSGVPPRM